MNIDDFLAESKEFLNRCEKNYVSEDEAIREDISGLRIFEKVIFAFGSAADPLFEDLKRKEVVHPEHIMPNELIEEGESVISFFLSYTNEIKRANREDMKNPSHEWLHGRIEGQEMVREFSSFVEGYFKKIGYEAAIPGGSSKFRLLEKRCSNWSERHVAYICGLGTFGVSKGIITENGMAGRLGSVITSCKVPITERGYTDIYEYCTMCGMCQKNCPAHAIDFSRGVHLAKDHVACDDFVESTRIRHKEGGKERYGCGKCQVGVPCESKIPGRRRDE